MVGMFKLTIKCVYGRLFYNKEYQIEQIFQKSCTLQKIITIIVQFFFCTQLLQY